MNERLIKAKEYYDSIYDVYGGDIEHNGKTYRPLQQAHAECPPDETYYLCTCIRLLSEQECELPECDCCEYEVVECRWYMDHDLFWHDEDCCDHYNWEANAQIHTRYAYYEAHEVFSREN